MDDVTAAVIAFRDERDWAQFHTPGKVAAALSVEAGELLELYLFGRKPSPAAVADEIADVLIYALTLAHDVGIDPRSAVVNKLERNRERYPMDAYRGSNAKAPT